MTGEGPVQIVSPFRPPHWVEIDLSRLPREQRRQEAAGLWSRKRTSRLILRKALGPVPID